MDQKVKSFVIINGTNLPELYKKIYMLPFYDLMTYVMWWNPLLFIYYYIFVLYLIRVCFHVSFFMKGVALPKACLFHFCHDQLSEFVIPFLSSILSEINANYN